MNVQYGDDWISERDGSSVVYHVTNKSEASINLALRQITSVIVHGIRGMDYGRYNVTLSGITTTYIAKSSFTSFLSPDPPKFTQSSNSTNFKMPPPGPAILFQVTGLDSTLDYDLTIVNAEEGKRLGIVNITTANVPVYRYVDFF